MVILPPSNLISPINYPKLSLGILTSYNEKIELYDNPIYWAKNNIDVEEIIKSRISLINAKKVVDANLPRKDDKLYNEVLDSMLSVKSINLEIYFNKISENIRISKIIGLYGYSGIIDRIKINENPKIPKEIYKIEEIEGWRFHILFI